MKKLLFSFALFCAIISNAQSIVSITPSTGAVGSTVNVVIIGTGTSFTNNTRFTLTQGLTNVIQLTNIVATSATRVTASVAIPSNAISGAYTLSAITLGLPLQLANAFTVTGGSRPASIESISPSEGDQGAFLPITITGVNTRFTQASNITATLVKGFTNNIFLSAFAANDTTLVCNAAIPQNAEPGLYNLVVNVGNTVLNKADAFEVKPVDFGEIVDVTPNEGEKGQSLDLTIKCSRTKFLTSGSFIYVEFSSDNGGYFEGSNLMVVNDTTLTVEVTLDNTVRLGSYRLFITGNGFSLNAPDMFTVIGDPNTEPRLKAIAPNYGYPGQKLDVTLTGTNTNFMQSSNVSVAIFSQSTFVEASSYNATNDSTIIASFNIPSNFPLGKYDFGYISDEDGYLDLKEVFLVVATSVKELVNELSQLFVYPNPVENELYFNSEEAVKSVTITDITGKQIVIPIEEVKETTANTYSIILDKYAVSKGIHFLRVETTQGVKYQKFLAQ